MKLFKVAMIAAIPVVVLAQERKAPPIITPVAQDKKSPPKTKPAEKAVPKEAIDPVCGMTVDPKTAPSAVYKGKTYYFCSADEKTDFEKTPEKYLKDANKK
jgi:YHS domain-containing protein